MSAINSYKLVDKHMMNDLIFNDILKLKKIRSSPSRWEQKDKPVAIIDGKLHRVNEIESHIEGESAYIVGIKQNQFQRLCSLLQVTKLYFYEMRVEDLHSIMNQSHLLHLGISWNTKLIDLSPISALASLQTLILEDTPKAHDISPLSNLTNLKALEFSGGIWNKNTANSLAPISKLRNLSELFISNIKVESGGLRPLGLCSSLEHLFVSNQFPTEDFAYLAAHLHNTKCEYFVPWVRLKQPVGDKDIMIIGKRKPFLNSKTDHELMNKYSNEWLELVQHFLAEYKDAHR